jgi:hypothetical protein
MSRDMLHHAELKIFFEVLHKFEFIWIWNLVWIWIWKPYRKEIEKELENPEKKKKEMQPNLDQPGRAPAPPDRRTPPVSGSPLSCALSLSRSLPSGADLSAPVSSPTRPSSLSASRAWFASCRAVAPRVPFSFSTLWACPVRSPPPSPWTGECALAHVAGFLGHDARPRAQLPS